MGLTWSSITDIPFAYDETANQKSPDKSLDTYADIENQRQKDVNQNKITASDINDVNEHVSYTRSVMKEVFSVGDKYFPESAHEISGPQSYSNARPYKLNYNYDENNTPGLQMTNKFFRKWTNK